MSNDINDILNLKETVGLAANEKKYPALRAISTVIKIVAYVNLIFCVIGAFYTMSSSELLTPTWIPILIGVIGVIAFCILLAISELINVFIDIEENTRPAIKS